MINNTIEEIVKTVYKKLDFMDLNPAVDDVLQFLHEALLKVQEAARKEERERIAKMLDPNVIRASTPAKYADSVIDIFHSLLNPQD